MSVQAAINAYWDGRAPGYDAYQQRPERRAADASCWTRIWSAALPEAPLDVLDVGTGSGHAAHLLAGLGHRVTAIDLSPGMLALARTHVIAAGGPGPDFRLGDAVDPPFAPGSFDAVTGRYVMWTLHRPEVAVANWRRLLRPGGVVAMVDSTWFTQPSDGLAGLYDGAERSLPLAAADSIDETAEALRAGGLVDVRVRPLEEVRDLDGRYGVAPGHQGRLQHLLTGRRGAPHRPA